MKTLRNLCMAAFLAVSFMLIPMLASVQVNAEGTEGYINYTGDEVAFMREDGETLGMVTPYKDGSYFAVDGDNVVIHYLPKRTTYKWLHWGTKDDADLSKDVVLSEEEAYDIVLPKTVCGYGIPVALVKSDGTPAGLEYGYDYYLAIPSEEKLPTMREVTRTELDITNVTGMFKAESAFIEKDSSGTYLKLALSGDSYRYFIKGNYDKAVAIGDNRDEWIAGYKNENGKWEFEIKVDDQSYVPFVSVSGKYLTGYENGENPLPRAFYPRQVTIDLDAKTIEVDDYKETTEITINNNVGMFKPIKATLTTTGGPNSNNYSIVLDLTMGSDAYDQLYVGEACDAYNAEDKDIIDATEGGTLFKVTVEKIGTAGKPETIESILDEPTLFSFRSKKNGTWYNRETTISKIGQTILFDPADADYKAVDAALKDIPEDLSLYTDDSAKVAEEALATVVRGYSNRHQDLVDAMAATLTEAAAGLTIDTEKVKNEAINLIQKAKEEYTTAAEKQAAVSAARDFYANWSEVLQNLIDDPTEDLAKEQEKADAQKAAEDKEAVEAAQALIEKAKANYATSAQKQAAINAAREAYKNLTDDQKKLIEDPTTDLDKEQAKADAQKAAEEKAKAEVPVGTQVTVGNFVYKTTSKTTAALVKPTKKTMAKVTIPAAVTIKGKSFKVTAIQANAFKKNTKLKALSIGANVTTIGASAFEGCVKISKITIPAAVTGIGNKAFYNCKKATKLVIKGTAIKTFGKKSFAKTGIKKLTAPKKKKAAYKKKLVKAGLKKTVK